MYAKFKCSTGLDTPEGSPPCRGRWAWVPRRPLELCRWELRLLVGPPKLNRSKDRGATKHDPPVLQVRELGKGLTSLSRKTPMLRKRQWRKLTLLGETGFQSHQKILVWMTVVKPKGNRWQEDGSLEHQMQDQNWILECKNDVQDR